MVNDWRVFEELKEMEWSAYVLGPQYERGDAFLEKNDLPSAIKSFRIALMMAAQLESTNCLLALTLERLAYSLSKYAFSLSEGSSDYRKKLLDEAKQCCMFSLEVLDEEHEYCEHLDMDQMDVVRKVVLFHLNKIEEAQH